MASAFPSPTGSGWIADFRPFRGRGKRRRRVRVPLDVLRDGEEQKSATEFAVQLETVCRLLEMTPRDEELIALAVRKGAIKERDAEALRDARDPKTVESPRKRELTLTEAAEQHPSTARERERDSRSYHRHCNELDEFLKFANVTLVQDVTLSQITTYIKSMKTRGHKYDTRRHRLLYLRRACMIGATQGIPDVIGGYEHHAGLKLDSREDPIDVDAWEVGDVMRAVADNATDPRIRAAVGLGVLMGLSPSEIFRLETGDFANELVHVGKRKAKNVYRNRILPVPPLVAEWLAPLLDGRGLEDPVFVTGHGNWFTAETSAAFMWGWYRAVLPPLRTERQESPLRKTFATWTAEVIPLHHIDQFLGRRIAGYDATSFRHYYAKLAASRKLQPSAEKIDSHARPLLSQV